MVWFTRSRGGEARGTQRPRQPADGGADGGGDQEPSPTSTANTPVSTSPPWPQKRLAQALAELGEPEGRGSQGGTAKDSASGQNEERERNVSPRRSPKQIDRARRIGSPERPRYFLARESGFRVKEKSYLDKQRQDPTRKREFPDKEKNSLEKTKNCPESQKKYLEEPNYLENTKNYLEKPTEIPEKQKKYHNNSLDQQRPYPDQRKSHPFQQSSSSTQQRYREHQQRHDPSQQSDTDVKQNKWKSCPDQEMPYEGDQNYYPSEDTLDIYTRTHNLDKQNYSFIKPTHTTSKPTHSPPEPMYPPSNPSQGYPNEPTAREYDSGLVGQSGKDWLVLITTLMACVTCLCLGLVVGVLVGINGRNGRYRM